MKKFISMIVLACMTTAMQAQETETSSCTKSCCSATCNKYSVLTNSFWSNWFVSANVGYNMFYSNEEKGLNDKPGLFDGSRSTIGVSVALGKWFTPGIGLRTRLSGFWGREVKPDAVGSLKNTDNNSYDYWDLQEQVLFNLHNLFLGYEENRLWNAIPYFGFGISRNMSANEIAHGYSLGLLNTFKLTKCLALNLDLGFNISDDNISGGATTNHQEYATSPALADRNFSVAVGLTYNFGKKTTWCKTATLKAKLAEAQSQVDELNARLGKLTGDYERRLAAKDDEVAALKRDADECAGRLAAANARADELAATTTNLQPTVLFRLASSVIDPAQYASIAMIAEYMKNHPDVRVQIKGYASPEGSLELNQKLSQARADAVRTVLINKHKIAADRLTAIGCGPTDKLFEQVEFNRIATFNDLTK